MEGFPKTENREKTPRFETVSLEVIREWHDAGGDIVKQERHIETNGTVTRITIEEVTYSAAGDVLYVSNTVTQVIE